MANKTDENRQSYIKTKMTCKNENKINKNKTAYEEKRN